MDSKKIYKKVYISSSYTHDIDSNLPPRNEIYEFFKKIVESVKNKFTNDTPKKITVIQLINNLIIKTDKIQTLIHTIVAIII